MPSETSTPWELITDGRPGTTSGSPPLIVLAFCDMRTLYLRNVPDDVVDRLGRLAVREGSSVNALAVRELSSASRRADNPDLLAGLPDLGVDVRGIVADLDAARDPR